MKAAEIFKQYIWLIDTIARTREISLQELNRRWVRTEMSGGLPMIRMTFNRHLKAIEEMFDISIVCRKVGREHLYSIENEEVLGNNNLQRWMLDSLTIGNLLMESSSLKDRILLENIPAGKQHLQPIIGAMKLGQRMEMTYRKFGQAEAYTILVDPYAIKVFKHRWYLLAKTSKRPEPSIYALDRIESIKETAELFEYPDHFDTELFFKDYYGVMGGVEQVERIVLRAYPPYINYLRTLPLHHSQKELESTPQHADFEFHLRPTFDFRQELLSQGNEVEVLEPERLRLEMQELLQKTLERYG